jgi:uncharacterized protein YbjT (DUF2867 family)
MILVSGVTGLVGRATAECLLGQGVACRGLARNAEKAADLCRRGLEFVQGDMLDSADMARAMAGITSALLVTPNGRQQLEMERTFAGAAAAAGLAHLVKISTIRARPDAGGGFPRMHFESEQFIRSLGLRSTMLRSNFFFQNLLRYAPSIAASGSFTLPVGRIGIGMVDVRDVAEIAARRLQDRGQESRAWPISGPELLDFHDVAARMSVVLGREIRFGQQSPADFRAQLAKSLADEWQVDRVCELFEEIAQQALGPVTDDAMRLLGRPPRKLESFLADYADAFEA